MESDKVYSRPSYAKTNTDGIITVDYRDNDIVPLTMMTLFMSG